MSVGWSPPDSDLDMRRQDRFTEPFPYGAFAVSKIEIVVRLSDEDHTLLQSHHPEKSVCAE